MSIATQNNSNNSGSTGLPKARARFLAQAIQLEEEGISGIVKVAIYTILGLIIAILAWMSLTQISEVTVSGGKVVPVGYIHNIQHLEGGLIGNIYVEDGDPVEAGDLLVNFAPPASQSEFDQLLIRKVILELDLARLAAVKEGGRYSVWRIFSSVSYTCFQGTRSVANASGQP